jgi:hypothetical protein
VRAPILTTGCVSVSVAVAPSVGDTLAGEINQRHVAVAHPALLRSLAERFQSSNHMGCSKRPHPWDGKSKMQLWGSWNRSSSTTLVGILALSTQSTTTWKAVVLFAQRVLR